MTHAKASIAADHDALQQRTAYTCSVDAIRIGFMLQSLFDGLRDRIVKRRRYRQMIAEIERLTQDDLIDIGAFQIDLYRAARQEIYG